MTIYDKILTVFAGTALVVAGVRGHPYRWLAAACLAHLLPQGHAGTRVEAGIGHQLNAQLIRLAFVTAREGQYDAVLSAGAESAHDGVALGPFDTGGALDHRQAELGGLLGRDAFVGVTRQHVRDLVADHCGQLILIAGDLEQAGVHADIAAGQGEGVDITGIDDIELYVMRRSIRGL